jgi:hypothetical protein
VPRSDTTPIERRTIPNGHRATDNNDVGAVRRGARLAGRGWLGQGFQQGPDLPVRVASVAAQGAEEGQPALLRPAADRLWGHMKKVRRPARCAGTWAGLAGATCAPVLAVVPRWRGRPYACRGQMPSRVLRRLAIFRCIPVRLGPGRCHSWTLTSLPLPLPAPDLELR